MAEFKITNCSSSFIEEKAYLAISCWAKVNEETRPKYQAEQGREGPKDVSTTNETTYKNVSKAKESKMPGGSSVSSLSGRSLKATESEIHQIVRVGSISRPVVYHY